MLVFVLLFVFCFVEKRSVALAVTEEGTREVLGIFNMPIESAAGWKEIFGKLQERGVQRIGLLVADGIKGMDTVYHASDACLGIMLPINLVKDITDLLLCQTFCIENSCQTVTFLLLVTQDGEDLRMEVAITVTGDTELKLTAMSIGRPRTITITLIPGLSTRNSLRSATIILSSIISIKS